MADFAGELNLNSRRKPIAQIKTGDLKGGIKKEQLSEKSQLIFDAVNKKDAQGIATDTVLDAEEMNALWEKLKEYAKNDKLSGREAKRLIKDLGLQDISKEDLFNFVNEIYGESEDIENSSVAEDGTIIINYKKDDDGNALEERISTDKTSQLSTTDADGNVRTAFLNENKKTQKIVDKAVNGDTTTYVYTDENGNVVLDTDDNEVMVRTEVVKNNGTYKSTVNYENGKAHDAVVVEGTLTSEYDYQTGEGVLVKTTEDKGNGVIATTEYEYKDNNMIVATITEGDKKTVQTLVNTENGVIPVLEEITEGGKKTTNQFDYQNNLKVETIEEGDNATRNIYQMVQAEDGSVQLQKRQQDKLVNGKQYHIEYDANGYTLGVVVQNGESPASIAKKFGCTVDELFEANPGLVHGKGNGRYFNVGEEIKIPKTLEADNKALQGRDSREQAIGRYQAHVAEQERQRALKQMGWNGKKDPMDGKTFQYGGKTYTVLGRKTNRERLLVMDKEGHIYTASHGKNGAQIQILKDEYVATTDYYDFNQNKAITLKNGKKYVPAPSDVKTAPDGTKYIEINGVAFSAELANGFHDKTGYYRDKYARTSVISENGSFKVLSGKLEKKLHGGERFVLNQRYLKASDAYMAAKGKNQNIGQDCYGCNGFKAITIDGETFYFDKTGYGYDGNWVEGKIAEHVKADLDKAANDKTLWIIPGTDETLMSAANKGIINDRILKRIDSAYQAEGYKPDDEYQTAYEAFLGTEVSRKEVYVLDATLVENNAIVDRNRRNEVFRTNIIDYGDTNENLQAGLKAISNRDDYDAVTGLVRTVNKEKGYQSQFKAQSDLSAYIYGVTDGDVDDISAAYNALIDPNETFLTANEVQQMRAEEGVYWIREARDHSVLQGTAARDYEQFFDRHRDSSLYKRVDSLLAEHNETSISGDERIAQYCGDALLQVGYASKELRLERLESALRGVKNAERMSKDAHSTGRSMQNTPGSGLGFAQAADMVSSAENYAIGLLSIKELINSEETYNSFMTLLSKKPELKAYWDKLVKEGKINLSDLHFESTKSNLTAEQIARNNAILEEIRIQKDVATREIGSTIAREGGKLTLINEVRRATGLGITRDQLNEALGHLNYSMHDLELAAQGKLKNAKTGEYISFETLLNEVSGKIGSVHGMNNLYQTYQQYGEVATDVLTAVATMPLAAGGVAKIYSFVSNGVKQFKVVQVVGNTVKELGVVKNLQAAKALLPARVVSVGGKLLNTERIFVSSGTGVTTGTLQYGIDRFDQLTSAAGDTMEARAFAEDKAIMTGVTTGAGMYVGMTTEGLDANLAQRIARAGINVTTDAGVAAGVEYSQRGEVSKEGFITNMAISLVANGAGIRGRRNSKPPVTPAETLTPTLTKASGHKPAVGAPSEVAQPSSVRVGKGIRSKTERINGEVSDLVANPNVTPEQLAQARNELGSMADPSIRRQGRQRIDERAAQFTSEQRAQYDDLVRQDRFAAAERVVNKKGYITEADGRVLREYARNTDNISELAALRDKIDVRQPGGKASRDILDARIAELNTANRTSSQVGNEVHSALDDAISGNKGLASLNDLKTHISATSDPAELNALFDKWMKVRKNCGANRKQVDALFKEKGLDIQTPNKKLTEAPAATVKPTEPEQPSLVKEVQTTADGSVEYMKNANGQPLKTTYKDSNGNVIRYSENTFDLNGNMTECIYKDAKGNVTARQEFKYDSNGNMTERTTFDKDGNITESHTFEPKPLSPKASDDAVVPKAEPDPIAPAKVDDAPAPKEPIAQAEPKPLKPVAEPEAPVVRADKPVSPAKAVDVEPAPAAKPVKPSTTPESVKPVAPKPDKPVSPAKAADVEPAPAAKPVEPTPQPEPVKSQSTTPEVKPSSKTNVEIIANEIDQSNFAKGWFTTKASRQTKVDNLAKRIRMEFENGSLSEIEAQSLLNRLEVRADMDGLSSANLVLHDINLNDYVNMSEAAIGTRFPSGKQVRVNDDAVLKLSDYSELNLADPQVKARLNSMKDGEVICVGREPDANGIVVGEGDMNVSRNHLKITKMDGKLLVMDNSTNGTFLGEINANSGPRLIVSEAPAVGPKPVGDGPLSRINELNHSRPELDGYRCKPNRRVEISSDARGIKEYFPKTTEEHYSFVQSRKDLFGDVETWDGTYWQGYTPADQHHGAWKMHLFSNSETDWQNMCEAVIPYLKEHGIDWKTFNSTHSATSLNGQVQEGKAFTIYPRDNVHMEQLARDLDYIIRNNKLGIENKSGIVGDRQMGETGRLFYRYEYKTGAVKDEILDLGNTVEYNRYDELYDGNSERIKRNGEASYLADDMTEADDPWFNFNPADLNSFGNFRRNFFEGF